MFDLEFDFDLSGLRWAQNAECAKPWSGVGYDDFFYEGRFAPNSKEQRGHIQRLRDICAECLVFDACRTYAESQHPIEGFWAGETTAERRERLSFPLPPPPQAAPTLKGLPLP